MNKNMEMIKVQSSNLDSIGYGEETKILVIKFHNGTYKYFEVPKQIYIDLLDASSKGKFFHNFIKNKYSYEKID